MSTMETFHTTLMIPNGFNSPYLASLKKLTQVEIGQVANFSTEVNWDLWPSV